MTYESQSKTKQALLRLKEGVLAFENSETFRTWLAFSAKFHRYSWRNSLLILLQKPDATLVKGFKGWLELGRVVRKGEKGITILAPRTHKQRVVTDDGEEIEQATTYFGAVSVFDISQTEPLPGHPNPFDPQQLIAPVLTEETGAELYDTLVEYLRGDGVTVLIGNTGSASGYYQPSTKTIVLRDAPTLQRLHVLIHEAGHHLFHTALADLAPETRDMEEVIVEAAAYVVASYFGFDTSQVAVPYVTTWLRGDMKVFERGLGLMQKLSATLIDALAESPALSAAA